MPQFTGQLRQNEIFGAISNMIISQQIFAGNVKGTYSKLVDEARTDGSMYGDTKLYYATDVLASNEWMKDAEATNLLKLHRPKAPECQAIYLDTFRQIPLTVSNYLTKRAFSDEYTFSQFNAVLLGWIRDTKRVYDSTTYNSYIGTAKGATPRQNIEFALSDVISNLEGEEKARMEGMTVAQKIADLLVELTDISRDFNDYGFLRSYSEEEIKIVWNSKWLNKISKLDLPTIFHKEALVKKLGDYSLPSRYFGEVIVEGGVSTGEQRSLVEKTYEDGTHIFAGDIIPTGKDYDANEAYTPDEDIICKIVVKLPPFMSAFETGTSFFNPRSLTETHFLTWGHNKLEYLKNYPMIAVHAD